MLRVSPSTARSMSLMALHEIDRALALKDESDEKPKGKPDAGEEEAF